MRLYKIQKNQDTIAYLQRYTSSKAFFNYTRLYEDSSYMTMEKLFDGVQSGKIAIFPIYENQNTDIILWHYKNNFDCYLMPYRDYKAIKKLYADSLVLSIPEEKKEDIQQKLPL